MIEVGEIYWWVSVKALAKIFNPFCINTWSGLKTPVSQYEVGKAIQDGRLRHEWEKPADDDVVLRRIHIERIAYFVEHGWEHQIIVEVLPTSDGRITPFPIWDGNHRFAAAVYRKDYWILAQVKGDIDLAKTYMQPFNTEEHANSHNRPHASRKIRRAD